MGPHDIELGQTVKDVSTGFEGMTIHKMEMLNGNVQYAIQPPMAPGATTYPDAMSLDYHLLEITGDGIKDRATPAPTDVGIKLGEKVRDKITGFVGTTTVMVTYINGCIRFWVEPTWKGDLKERRSEAGEYFDYGRLELVDPPKPVPAPAPAPDLTKAEEANPVGQQPPTVKMKGPPGGPGQRIAAPRAER